MLTSFTLQVIVHRASLVPYSRSPVHFLARLTQSGWPDLGKLYDSKPSSRECLPTLTASLSLSQGHAPRENAQWQRYVHPLGIMSGAPGQQYEQTLPWRRSLSHPCACKQMYLGLDHLVILGSRWRCVRGAILPSSSAGCYLFDEALKQGRQ